MSKAVQLKKLIEKNFSLPIKKINAEDLKNLIIDLKKVMNLLCIIMTQNAS